MSSESHLLHIYYRETFAVSQDYSYTQNAFAKIFKNGGTVNSCTAYNLRAIRTDGVIIELDFASNYRISTCGKPIHE